MEGVKFLEHKADIKVKIFGKTKKEIFKQALLAMAEILGKSSKKGALVKINIKVESLGPDFLLIDFLNEVLFFSQTKKAIFEKIKFLDFSDKKIVAQIYGKKVKSFKEDIKAATYHNLKLEKKDKFWQAILLFDI